MPTIIEMPRLSDTMREGTLARWILSEGAAVEPGDELAEVETDKAVMTFESFDDGVLLKRLIGEGDTVPLGTPIAVLGEEGEDLSDVIDEILKRVEEGKARSASGLAGEEPTATPEPDPAPVEIVPEPQRSVAPAAVAVASASPSSGGDLASPTDADGIRVKASPVARRIAQQRGIDLTTVAGSGPRGRIIKRDLEGLDATRRVAAFGRRTPKEDVLVRTTQMRKTIASRLVQAKHTAPHYYLNITVNFDRLVTLRQDINESQDVQKVSYNDLVMRACVVALQDHPEVNAAWEGNQIRQYGGVHLGFAVAMPQGLITPVVRNAELLGIVEMAQQVRALAGRARESKLESAEYTGNSFCVSNLGMFGIEHFTAVINPPAACILAVGALRKEPVVRDGEVAVGHVMALTLSCDHRVVDGAMGAKFLQDLKLVLERPLHLLEWR